MKSNEESNQSKPVQDETQRQKEQEEQQGNKNWRPRSKKEIYLLEKMGMRIRVTRPDSESEN